MDCLRTAFPRNLCPSGKQESAMANAASQQSKIHSATPSAAPLARGGCEVVARLVGVTRHYGKVLALDAIDLEVRSGEVLAVLGPNGAGKTTALALLMGLRVADKGRVELFGGDPRVAHNRRRLGVMLQIGQMPDTLTVAEHIKLFSGYYPNPRPLTETLELAGLSDLEGRRYGALSGGQQRRVQFALAICGRPQLLFVDEPTTGLDVTGRRDFWNVLRTMAAEGVGIVLTTHYLEEADALAQRIVLLHRGRILADDTPAAIKARAAGKRIRCVTMLDPTQMLAWPGVDAVECKQGTTEITTRESEAVLRRLLADDAGVAGIEVIALGLEDAFVELTRETQS